MTIGHIDNHNKDSRRYTQFVSLIHINIIFLDTVFIFYDKKDDSNVPIVNFPFICSNIPAVPAYGVYISQLMRYSRACGYYQEQTTQWPKEKGQKEKQ